MVPKREATRRQLDGAAAGPFDSLKEQLHAVFNDQPKPVEDLRGSNDKIDEPLRNTLMDFQRPSHQSKPMEDLHGSNDRIDEPLRITPTLKGFQRPSPQRKPEEEDEPVERDDLRPGITSYRDQEASERQASYDLSIENKMTRRSSRGFARYLVAILIGVAATLAWQSYGDVAKRIIAARAPELGSSPEAKQMIANSIQQLGWTKPPASSEEQALPVAQTSPAAPSIDPAQIQQMARDLATLRQTVEQLAAGLDHVTSEIGKLEAADVEILGKITPPPPPRPVAAPARKPAPIATPSSPTPIKPPTSLAPIPPPDR